MTHPRAAILAAILAAAGFGAIDAQAAGPAGAAVEAPEREPAAALRATSPPNAAPDRTYAKPDDALLEADLDYLVREARRALARGDAASTWPVLIFADELAAGRFAEARAALVDAPGGLQGGLADLFEPFLLAAEGSVDRGVERVDHGLDGLPAPLPEVARALVFESAGRFTEAGAVYSLMAERLDLTPPPENEPATIEEFQRSLNSVRILHALYRAALVQHRLGHAAEARRLYGIVAQFAPRSADVERNLARLGEGQPPLEAALNPLSAAGRWMLFVSEYLTQAESLTAALAQQDPAEGLSSAAGTTFLQVGIALAPDAGDWRLYAAQQLIDAGGLDGAERVLAGIASNGPFAPDAEITRAAIQLERRNDAEAVAAAERAVALGGARWAVIASAGDIYRSAGRTREAISAFGRALSMVEDAKDRADVLGWRASAHRFSGDVAAASADMRAAFALDQSVDTRLRYVSILMDDPQGWRDGVQVARGLFAEQPDSVSRLNALGYALIQRSEGLEEGYRLLWRGFNNGQTDYAVVDSLGWAYYLHGEFERARALIERANDLSVADPNAEILDHLGDVYWRLNRRDQAREVWRAALEARPDALRRRALERKLTRGPALPAPRRRALPTVTLPEGPAERGDL